MRTLFSFLPARHTQSPPPPNLPTFPPPDHSPPTPTQKPQPPAPTPHHVISRTLPPPPLTPTFPPFITSPFSFLDGLNILFDPHFPLFDHLRTPSRTQRLSPSRPLSPLPLPPHSLLLDGLNANFAPFWGVFRCFGVVCGVATPEKGVPFVCLAGEKEKLPRNRVWGRQEAEEGETRCGDAPKSVAGVGGRGWEI